MRIPCEILFVELLFVFVKTNSSKFFEKIIFDNEQECSVHVSAEKVIFEDLADDLGRFLFTRQTTASYIPVTLLLYDNKNLTHADSEEDYDSDESNQYNSTTTTSSINSPCSINFLFLQDVKVLKVSLLQPAYANIDNTFFVSLIWNTTLQADLINGVLFDSLEEELIEMLPQKILFIKDTPGSTIQWSVICYFCDIHILWRNETLTNLDDAENSFFNLNSQGYGKLAHIKAATKLIHDVHCEAAYYCAKTSIGECDDGKITLQVIERQLNITFEEIYDYYENSDIFVPLVLGQNMNPVELHSSRSQFIRQSERAGLFFYCTFLKDQMYEKHSWWFFLEPFDYYVWCAILCVFIVISVIHRDIRFGLDVFVSFLNQRLQIKWTKFASGFTIVITVITIVYQDTVTSSFIAPPGQKVFKKVSELLTFGYRYVIPSSQYIPVLAGLAGSKFRKLTGKDFSAETNLVVEPSIDQFNINITTRMFKTLAELKGTIVIYNEMKIYLKRHKLGTRENQYPGGVNCHIVPEIFDILQFNWITRGILAIRVIKLLNHWFEAGMTAVYP
ncbi:unnamed protein product [Orchesella dallaii]|uniref:Uncharacterized protein n=1 Tax=Orchesella dallaii TaxID=48710 RepID=A0ABP1QXQ5_9HEXA